MKTGQLTRILVNLYDSRKSDPLRIIVNGIAFPIKQRLITSKNGVVYLVADTNPAKGDIVGIPYHGKRSRKSLTTRPE